MIDRRAATLLLKRMLYIGIGLIIIFYQLLPLKTTPPTWVGPDLLMAITIVYAIRRPAYIPIGSVALLFLFSDFILHRPPGMMSLFMVIGCEWLKRRSQHLRVATFGVEWLTIALVIIMQAMKSFRTDIDNGAPTTGRIICHAGNGNNPAVSGVDGLGTPSSGHSQITNR
jgi:rod shape-determining protein MreD